MLGKFGLLKKGKRPGIDSLLVGFPPPGNPIPFNQTDWPNPVLRVSFFATCLTLSACIGTANILPLTSVKRERAPVVTKFEPRKVQQNEYIPNLLTSTLNQAVNQPPFMNYDQPNPTLARKVLQIDPIPDLLTSTLNQAATHNPFIQTDQPNPIIRRVTQVDPIPDLLTSTLNQAATQGPFGQAYWPNPYSIKVQQPDSIQPSIALTAVVTTAPFYQNDWPNPVLLRKVTQVDPVPDLLTSTLNQAVNQPPFIQTDQPNPVLARKVQQPPDPPNLTGALLFPFKQTEWPNPVLARKVLQPEIIVNYVALTVGAPFKKPEQPNPVLRIPPDRSQIPPDLLTSTLNQAATHNPFIQTEQPNPVLRTRTVQPEIIVNAVVLTPVGTPFNQSDWPNPVRKLTYTVQPEIPINISPLTQVVVPVGAVFTKIEPRRVQQPEIPINILPLISFVPSTIPNSLDDQPNPILARRVQQPEIRGNLLPLISVKRPRGAISTRIEARRVQQPENPQNFLPLSSFNPGAKPFHQDDWFTPRKRFDWLSQQLHVVAYGSGTATPTLPFNLDDQPNPVRRKHYNQVEQPPNVTIRFKRYVFRQPLPTAVLAKRQVQPEIPINRLPIITPPGNPKFLLDQPNPVLRVRQVQPEIPVNLKPLTTIPLPPFFLNDQPNPVRLKPGYWVFQFDRLNLALQPSAWSGINDSQTPAWTGEGEICTADSTLGTADTTLLTADLSCANAIDAWNPVDDSDTPAWVPIPDAQTPGWNAVDDSETPGWTPINTAPGGSASS